MLVGRDPDSRLMRSCGLPRRSRPPLADLPETELELFVLTQQSLSLDFTSPICIQSPDKQPDEVR